MADGVTIQRASHAALAQGVSLRWILASSRPCRAAGLPLLLINYLNPLLAVGPEALAAAAVRAGVTGFIVPDLPFDESAELRSALAAQGLALIQMVTPVTRTAAPGADLRRQSGLRVCGDDDGHDGKERCGATRGHERSDSVRSLSPVPVCAGFGIRGREQLELLRAHVDGVVIGSALVEVLERGEDRLAAAESCAAARRAESSPSSSPAASAVPRAPPTAVISPAASRYAPAAPSRYGSCGRRRSTLRSMPWSLPAARSRSSGRDGERRRGEKRHLGVGCAKTPGYFAAVEASRRYAGFKHHRFPTCFVCGTQRSRGDGMRGLRRPGRAGR